ncbi:hypothetical protein VCHA53O466_50405 [Vibrio chagasii]|nr:hypothetical protein VCHA53O466_50405 [Vibrio chagasii]
MTNHFIQPLEERRCDFTVDDNGDIKISDELDLSFTSIMSLPDNLTVNGWLDLSHTPISSLPDNLTVQSIWNLRISTSLTRKNQGEEGRVIFAIKVNGINAISAGFFLGSIEEFCK